MFLSVFIPFFCLSQTIRATLRTCYDLKTSSSPETGGSASERPAMSLVSSFACCDPFERLPRTWSRTINPGNRRIYAPIHVAPGCPKVKFTSSIATHLLIKSVRISGRRRLHYHSNKDTPRTSRFILRRYLGHVPPARNRRSHLARERP